MSTAAPTPQHPWFQNDTFRVSEPGTWPSSGSQKYVSQDSAAEAATGMTNDPENGGSSYDLYTGKFAEPHWGDSPLPGKPDEFFVGKEEIPRTSRPNPTVTLSRAQFGTSEMVNHIWNAMTVNASNPRAHLGTWREQPTLESGKPNPRAGLTDLDVSGKYVDEAHAVALGSSRGEREIFGTNPGRGIETPYGARVRAQELRASQRKTG